MEQNEMMDIHKIIMSKKNERTNRQSKELETILE